MINEAQLRAGINASRHKTSVIVADATHFKALRGIVASRDARRALAVARRMDAGFVVLAGQLHKAGAGCYSMVIRDAANLDLLASSAAMAFERLSELGETCSAWFIAVDGEARVRVNALVAQLAATEGNA